MREILDYIFSGQVWWDPGSRPSSGFPAFRVVLAHHLLPSGASVGVFLAMAPNTCSSRLCQSRPQFVLFWVPPSRLRFEEHVYPSLLTLATTSWVWSCTTSTLSGPSLSAWKRASLGTVTYSVETEFPGHCHERRLPVKATLMVFAGGCLSPHPCPGSLRSLYSLCHWLRRCDNTQARNAQHLDCFLLAFPTSSSFCNLSSGIDLFQRLAGLQRNLGAHCSSSPGTCNRWLTATWNSRSRSSGLHVQTHIHPPPTHTHK